MYILENIFGVAIITVSAVFSQRCHPTVTRLTPEFYRLFSQFAVLFVLAGVALSVNFHSGSKTCPVRPSSVKQLAFYWQLLGFICSLGDSQQRKAISSGSLMKPKD